MKSIIEEIQVINTMIPCLWLASADNERAKDGFDDFIYRLGDSIGDDDLIEELNFLIDVNHKR